MITDTDAIAAFRDAMSRDGISPPERLIGDGKLHRFPTNGRHRDHAGWYVLYLDDLPAGAYGDWRAGIEGKWHAIIDRELSPAEKANAQRRTALARKQRDAAKAEAAKLAAEKAVLLWHAANEARADHPYLVRKQIGAHGIRQAGTDLIVPLQNKDGYIRSLEYIAADGTKRFLADGDVKGCSFEIAGKEPHCIAEGYATAASIHEATGFAAVVAFNDTNLEPVATALRAKKPDAEIIICADDDYRVPGNPGIRHATNAADSAGAKLAQPDFGVDRPDGATDFNDLHAHRGADAVRVCIVNAQPPLAAKDTARANNEINVVRSNGGQIQGRSVSIPDSEPWPDPVDGSITLDAILAAIRRYVIVGEHEATAMALWCAHSHAHDAAESSPRLVFTSPQRRCGKTRAVEFMSRMCRRPVSVSGITAAALLRLIEALQPTVLIDEMDAQMGGDREMAEALRALLNAGFDRTGARFIKNVARPGGNYEPCEFSVWTPVVLAGIGDLPDTVRDRSIIVPMSRKLPRESVQRLRTRDGGELRDLARMLARWTADNMSALTDVRPEMPEALHDRAADAWEPLVAIADTAGGNWPTRAREAALVLSRIDNDTDHATMLLTDVRTVFLNLGADALPGEEIVSRLSEMTDRPWADIAHGRPITANRLAKMLNPYEIHSEPFRNSNGKQRRCYLRCRLDPVWERYLPALSTPDPLAGAVGQA